MEHPNQSLQEQIDNVLFNSIEAVGLRETGTIRDLDTLVIDREKATQALTELITEAQEITYEKGKHDGFDACLELWERTTNFTVKERDEFIKMGRKFLAELKQTGEKE